MLKRIVLAAMVLAVLSSCAPMRAAVDYSMYENIVWPGVPEKPRITYLWSLWRVAGAREGDSQMDISFDWDSLANAERSAIDFMAKPYGVYADGSGMLFVTDMGAARVVAVDIKTSLTAFMTHVQGEPFVSPVGVVAMDGGFIYVSDSDLKVVAAFDRKYQDVFTFEGEFQRPTGLALDAKRGYVYVVDTWAHCIYRYSLSGKRLGVVGEAQMAAGQGGDGASLYYPTHIAVDKEGRLYVTDTLNFRVRVFTPEGEEVTSFGMIGDSYDTFDKIKGIALDSEGHIYVTDSAQDMVKIYDAQGRLLLFFGQPGTWYGDLKHPSGIWIDGSDTIYVSDTLNHRVQAFRFLGGN